MSVTVEAHGSGETQPDSQTSSILLPTSSPVSMTPQPPDAEETVIATPEAKETELDHSPTPDTPRPEPPNIYGSKTSEV